MGKSKGAACKKKKKCCVWKCKPGKQGPEGPAGPAGQSVTGMAVLPPLQDVEGTVPVSPFVAFCSDEKCFNFWGCANYEGGVVGLQFPNPFLQVPLPEELNFAPENRIVDTDFTSGLYTNCIHDTENNVNFPFSGKVFLRQVLSEHEMWFEKCTPLVFDPFNSTLDLFSFKLCGKYIPPFLTCGGFDTELTMFQPFVEGDPNDSLLVPPDPIIAAGTDRLIVMANTQIALYDKTGTLLVPVLNLNGSAGFWGTNVTPAVSNDGADRVFDPWIVYDPHANRFIATAVRADRRDVVPANRKGYVVLAISQTSTPADFTAASWYFYQLDRTLDPGVDPTFPDYAKLGYDTKAYYISESNFRLGSLAFVNHKVFAITKSSILGGGAAVVTDNLIVTASGTFIFPVEIYDTVSLAMYCVQAVFTTGVTLWSIPTLTPGSGTSFFVPVPGTPINAFVPTVPQPDGKRPLDPVGIRFMTGVMRDHRLWCAHTVSQADILDPVTLTAKTIIKWYEIQPTLGGALLIQFQAIDPSGSAGRDRIWMPHLNVDGDGNMALGCSISSPTRIPSMAITGRYSFDPLGTTQGIAIVRPGNNSYDPGFPAGSNRWGDYSGLALDPDEITFWLYNEYPTFDPALPILFGFPVTGDTWRTAVFCFRFDPDLVPEASTLSSLTCALSKSLSLSKSVVKEIEEKKKALEETLVSVPSTEAEFVTKH